jgi:hypothetical protein
MGIKTTVENLDLNKDITMYVYPQHVDITKNGAGWTFTHEGWPSPIQHVYTKVAVIDKIEAMMGAGWGLYQ